ncbi:co-chaperone DjlA [Candidatus Thioglobus sp.]|jgi:DnaJ like chaperone protein|uniref:co-chaperone DjlA n=1 Tax=Candidatus Thioglobus sp. TaxID=2026721 RepID=UPI001DF34DC0|nr:co-chaperone DjlA [Candidatus Thioglobus sp.]MBT3277671.1 co-chaperone DjlA [Candidatus Thioglobus sp.]MBT3446434.1 co-chaperone DjlA [Candidatus Thioglobus sp.]MBT3744338.1 co-chaperone DjlA [Candidatus Thioglobus sp.]MBT4000576.1 co-chaperone DjlA [Candidatus Thioglobus sp.]MBT4181891.1 co-chaperone DjlA [Candidatus Thioglobus sp.]
MSWWTTVLGGAFGFMLGGPLGAMLGAAFAGNFSKNKASFGGFDKGYHLGDQQRVQAAFFSSLFSVMGYLAKVDGKVSKSEILLAQQVMQHMQLAEDMQKVAKELFNQGKQASFNLDEVLEQFRLESHRRTHLVRMFLEIQIQATYADGVLDDKERDALKYIAQKLHFSLQELENLIQQFAATTGHTSQLSVDDAYVILGVDKSLTDKELKRAYRRLLAQHHPDKLVAKGLPEEMMIIAKEKTQEIISAYELIKKQRGMR